MLGRVTSAIGHAGGSIGAIDLVEASDRNLVRDIVVNASSEADARRVVETLKSLNRVKVQEVSDRTFRLHRGGKIEVTPKIPIRNRDELAMVYTPGVARVSLAIARKADRAWPLTIKSSTVAIVTDGSAVLGLGNIGPFGALPVMEGKAMLFKSLADLNAFPICLATQEVPAIVETVRRIAPVFGGINLEDISAPRCFEVEEALSSALDIPVMHDDQHGTAVAALSGLINALKVVGKKMKSVRVVIAGAGAAAIGTAKLLRRAGAGDIVVCDRLGAIYSGRTEHMNFAKEWAALNTNKGKLRGSLREVLRGADVFLGLSAGGQLKPADVKRMARNPVVFAMANPVPEIMPEDIPFARVVATGRSDYPNQINNALVFPGVFKGALAVRAKRIAPGMLLAAARAIADAVPPKALGPDFIIPSIFTHGLADAVAEAVSGEAVRSHDARGSDLLKEGVLEFDRRSLVPEKNHAH